jgi:hypothetical protein
VERTLVDTNTPPATKGSGPAPPSDGPTRTGKRVAIVQSNYIPWKGYFDLINRVDEFILYDEVQFTRRDWRNRNRIKTPHGVQWLTIPVESKGRYRQRIRDTVVCDNHWRREHWATLRHCYSRSPWFGQLAGPVEQLLLGSESRYLSEINHSWLCALCDILGIRTRLSWSEAYRSAADDPTGRLLEICAEAGAVEYLSGPAAKAYLKEDTFSRAGVRVTWMDYSGYPEYPQLYPPFDHYVSVLDLLFMTGCEAPAYLKGY